MPATIKKRRIPRRTGIQSGAKHGSKRVSTSNAQPSARKRAGRPDQLQKKGGLQRRKTLFPSASTPGLDLTGIAFANKVGYNILKEYGGSFTYSRADKLKALMLYECMKLIPGFVDKKFSKLADAITYVYEQAFTLIGDSYGLIYNKQDVDAMGYPRDGYHMQIVYETFDPTHARWQSYGGVDKATKNKPNLRKALYMCIHLIIHRFGFTLFDGNGGDMVMSLSDWTEGEVEACNSEIVDCYESFQNENKRAFDHKHDYQTAIGQSIAEAEERRSQLESVLEEDEEVATPLRHRINSIKPDLVFLKKMAKKHAKEPVGDWISHIIMLTEYKFNITNYIGDAYRTDNQMGIDEDGEHMGPTSAYGYIFDGDNAYAQSVNDNYNEYVGNYEIVPFVIHKTIIPEAGRVFETENVPLGEWINKIFHFTFDKLKYETY